MIEDVGVGVDPARVGERVWIWNGGWQRQYGTAAERIALPAEQAVRLPDGTGFAEGACLGIPAMTAWRAVFADGPAGTQVPERVIEAVSTAMVESVSNVGGPFPASERSGRVVDAARAALADLVGGRPDEIVFGPNMTTLTFAFSRAVAQSWLTGDRIVVSRLDHDANVTPWVMAAADRGVEVDIADIDTTDMSLDLDHLESLLTDRTRLVAVTHTSNILGTVNPWRSGLGGRTSAAP